MLDVALNFSIFVLSFAAIFLFTVCVDYMIAGLWQEKIHIADESTINLTSKKPVNLHSGIIARYVVLDTNTNETSVYEIFDSIDARDYYTASENFNWIETQEILEHSAELHSKKSLIRGPKNTKNAHTNFVFKFLANWYNETKVGPTVICDGRICCRLTNSGSVECKGYISTWFGKLKLAMTMTLILFWPMLVYAVIYKPSPKIGEYTLDTTDVRDTTKTENTTAHKIVGINEDETSEEEDNQVCLKKDKVRNHRIIVQEDKLVSRESLPLGIIHCILNDRAYFERLANCSEQYGTHVVQAVYHWLLYSGLICALIHIARSMSSWWTVGAFSLSFWILYLVVVEISVGSGLHGTTNTGALTFQKHFQYACQCFIYTFEEMEFYTKPTLKKMKMYCISLLSTWLLIFVACYRIYSLEREERRHFRAREAEVFFGTERSLEKNLFFA